MKRVEKIISILLKRYKLRFWKGKPFHTLITTVLSQRTKDEVTDEASKRLFETISTPEDILKLSKREIEKLIYPVGFYRQKAGRIKEICRILLKKYKGSVPKSREELTELPGVGGKTADIVLSYSYGKSVIAVDVHVAIVSQRLGFTKNKYPEKIREDLHNLIHGKDRLIINETFVEFGKEICQTRLPKCYICPASKLCPYLKKTPDPHS